MSTAKAKPPERVSRRRRAARARTSGRARRCGLLFPPIAHYGVRVGLPYRHAGRSWNLSKYGDHCVRSKDTLLLLELSNEAIGWVFQGFESSTRCL
jgi:hypothetical protein